MSNRFWVRHEVRRRNHDGSISIHCSKCGREIMRVTHSNFMSVSKCQLCVLKEQGVINAEDYVLTQYRMPDNNMGGPPIPIDADDSIASGVLLLHPEEKLLPGDIIPQVGGIIGTIKSMFRTLGFAQPKPVPTVSKTIATEERSGPFGPAKKRR